MFESALYTPLPQVFVLCWWFCMLTTLKVTSRALDSKMFARDEHLFLSHENRSTSFEISNSKRISSCPLCGSHEHNFWWYWGPFFVIKSYDMNYDASVHTKLVSRVKATKCSFWLKFSVPNPYWFGFISFIWSRDLLMMTPPMLVKWESSARAFQGPLNFQVRWTQIPEMELCCLS